MLRLIANTPVELQATGIPEALTDDVYGFLEEIAAAGHLHAGAVFRYGPLLLRLAPTEAPGQLRVVVPGYDDEGAQGTAFDAGPQLAACARQATLCTLLGVEPAWASLDAQLGVFGGPIGAAGAVYGRRLQEEEEEPGGVSGWLLACAPSPGTLDVAVAELDARYPEGIAPLHVGALLAACPALLPALALPTGWGAQVQGERLVAVYDPEGNETLPASALARLR